MGTSIEILKGYFKKTVRAGILIVIKKPVGLYLKILKHILITYFIFHESTFVRNHHVYSICI